MKSHEDQEMNTSKEWGTVAALTTAAADASTVLDRVRLFLDITKPVNVELSEEGRSAGP